MLLNKKIYGLEEIFNGCLDGLVNKQLRHLALVICEKLEQDNTDIQTSITHLLGYLEKHYARTITLNTDSIIFEENICFSDFENLTREVSEALLATTGKCFDEGTYDKIRKSLCEDSYIKGITFRVLNIAGKSYSCYSIDT